MYKTTKLSCGLRSYGYCYVTQCKRKITVDIDKKKIVIVERECKKNVLHKEFIEQDVFSQGSEAVNTHEDAKAYCKKILYEEYEKKSKILTVEQIKQRLREDLQGKIYSLPTDSEIQNILSDFKKDTSMNQSDQNLILTLGHKNTNEILFKKAEITTDYQIYLLCTKIIFKKGLIHKDHLNTRLQYMPFYCDGHFKTPKQIKQDYKIRFFDQETNQFYTMCRIFLSDKKLICYKAMWKLIQDVATELYKDQDLIFQPYIMFFDQESAPILSFQEKFPDSIYKLDRFHTVTNLIKKAQKLGLVNSNQTLRKEVKQITFCFSMIQLVPFKHLEKLRKAFEVTYQDQEQMQPLLEFCLKYWDNQKTDNPLDIYALNVNKEENLYKELKLILPTTTNNVEGDWNKDRQFLGHPTKVSLQNYLNMVKERFYEEEVNLRTKKERKVGIFSKYFIDKCILNAEFFDDNFGFNTVKIDEVFEDLAKEDEVRFLNCLEEKKTKEKSRINLNEKTLKEIFEENKSDDDTDSENEQQIIKENRTIKKIDVSKNRSIKKENKQQDKVKKIEEDPERQFLVRFQYNNDIQEYNVFLPKNCRLLKGYCYCEDSYYIIKYIPDYIQHNQQDTFFRCCKNVSIDDLNKIRNKEDYDDFEQNKCNFFTDCPKKAKRYLTDLYKKEMKEFKDKHIQNNNKRKQKPNVGKIQPNKRINTKMNLKNN